MRRAMAAMAVDKEEYKGSIDLSNFQDLAFHNFEAKKEQKKKCSVCNDFFLSLEKYVNKIKKNRKYSYRTFLIGTKLSSDLVEREENLWERIGIDYCEPIKAEINREMGKLVEKAVKAKFDPKRPDVNIILNIENASVEISSNPLFI